MKVVGWLIGGALGISIVFFVTRTFLSNIITGTTVSDDIMTFIVPASIGAALFIILFMVIYNAITKRRK